MEVFDNVSRIVRDDLVETIKPNSRVSIAAACFSIYAYQELKKQLSGVEECRFIFTSPTFVTEKTASVTGMIGNDRGIMQLKPFRKNTHFAPPIWEVQNGFLYYIMIK